MSQENNFIPSQDGYKPLTPFRLFVKSNFPFIEATYEALDNYGLYCKIVEYLNTVIENENTVESNVQSLYDAFVSLNNYVSDYFDNLDVQEEINNKLDEMATSGVLQDIVSSIFSTLNQKIDAVASGSPLVASSTSEMTDTTRVYVNTSDGYWYYYNGTTWVAGGVYQSTAISPNDISIDGRNVKSSKLAYTYGFDKFETIENLEQGNIASSLNSELNFQNSPIRVRINRDNPLQSGSYNIKSFDNYSFYFVKTDSNLICTYQSGWKKEINIDVLPNEYGFMIIKKDDDSNILPSDAALNVRFLSGSYSYNIPKIITENPIEFDTSAHNVTFKAGTKIKTPFSTFVLESDVVKNYTPAANTLRNYIIIYNVSNKTIDIILDTAAYSYNYIILGYFTCLIGQIVYVDLKAPYNINNENINNNKFTASNQYDIEFQNSGLLYPTLGVTRSTTRVRIKDALHFDGKILIKNNNISEYKFAYKKARKVEDTLQEYFDSGWITNGNLLEVDCSIDYIGIQFATSSGSGNLTPNEVINNFTIIKKYNDNKKTNVLPHFHSVGHQGCIDANHRGNSRSAFIYAAKNGRTDIECDVVSTSDGVIVLNHDLTITDDNNESITIGNVTYSELLTHTFRGETIATLAEFLEICKRYGVNAYIDHLNYLSESNLSEMYRLIRLYKMDKRITFLSYINLFETLKNTFPYARLLLLPSNLSDLNDSLIQQVLSYKTNTNEVGFDLNHTIFNTQSVFNLLDNYSDIILEFWTVDNIATYSELLPKSNGITSNNIAAIDL